MLQDELLKIGAEIPHRLANAHMRQPALVSPVNDRPRADIKLVRGLLRIQKPICNVITLMVALFFALHIPLLPVTFATIGASNDDMATSTAAR
jgi:hypothetical protein